MEKISFYHIGARQGEPIYIPPKFKGDFVNVFFDADSDCIEQIKEINRLNESHVLPYCLSDRCGKVPFHINYDPFTSSVYRMNPEYANFYTYQDNLDYIISEVTKVMEERSIEAITLDYLASQNSVQAPDFLTIDTQGSEYDILLGAKDTLKNVLAVITEAEFHPIYTGQRLFGDIVNLLSDDFHFARFHSLPEASQYRQPIGLRGFGFHMATDALFLKKLDGMSDLKLRKLALISIFNHLFEYALECLRRSKGFTGKAEYLKFLTELEQTVEKMPPNYPDTFASKYTFEESKARFEKDYVIQPTQSGGWIEESIVPTDELTKVEELLIKYGLEKQAGLLKKRRLAMK